MDLPFKYRIGEKVVDKSLRKGVVKQRICEYSDYMLRGELKREFFKIEYEVLYDNGIYLMDESSLTLDTD